jgi:tRNA dimethylallyltransferase
LKYLIVIGGATATGKTALAVWLAQQLGTEILSADSRQFYRGMDIGTAKPGARERTAARHHFIDSLDVQQPYSAGDYESDALRLLTEIFHDRDAAILTGGSGLFIRAVCEGLDEFPVVSEADRRWVAQGAEQGGLAWLQEQLKSSDPVYYQQVDRDNPARLRRALEVCRASGKPYSSFLQKEKTERPFQSIYILLELPRPELYKRIEDRVDNMVTAGLEQEAHALLPYRNLPALQTVGYEEWFDCFDGKSTREATIAKIKQHTRNYAKRQATWFRKHGPWMTFRPDDKIAVLQYIKQQMTGNQALRYYGK